MTLEMFDLNGSRALITGSSQGIDLLWPAAQQVLEQKLS